MAAALAAESRRHLLEYLAQGERSVEVLAQMTGLSIANGSKHLQALRAAGLVQARKEGLRVYYALAGDDVVELYSMLHRVAETRVAEVERLVRTWLRQEDAMEPVPPAELLERAAKLPKRKEIVAYCRGPYCLLSFDAMRTLRERGMKARRLVDGFPEWRAAGLAVER